MRLIDADALFNWNGKKLSDAVKYGNKDSEQQSWSYSTLMMYEIADEINDAPTIEPRRGEWVCDETGLYCSACEESVFKNLDADVWSAFEPPYCPNCGAAMSGAEMGREG